MENATMQEELSEKYKTYLQQLGYNKNSVNVLPACVQDFLEYTNTTEVKEISSSQIQSFHEHLKRRKHKRKQASLSEIYIHHHIYALKVFFTYLEQTQQLKSNPISNLKFKQPKVNTRQPLSKEEITQLFAAAQSHKEVAILHLFYSCGVRRTEGENLNTNDIHFNKNLLYIREGKGAKRRVIPLTEKIKRDLEDYLRRERKKVNEAAFILNTENKRMSGNSYNKALKKLIKRSELNKEISLHHLRHSIATHLLENGLGIEYVRDFLGHSHLESTQVYAKVNKHQLRKL
jgi:integrase/recombinase XerD